MPSDDYDIPRPSKIRLKTTRAEQAERIYRKEQHRAAREAERIKRANGGYGSPERTRPESVSPPRYGPRAGRTFDDIDDDRRPEMEMGREEWADKFAHMAEELSSSHNPFAYYSPPPLPGFAFGPGQRIPHRFQHPSNGHHPPPPPRRSAAEEVRERGGPIPNMADMTDEEYRAFIRRGMRARQHARDMDDYDRERAAKRARDLKREREEEAEREREEKREKRRAKREGKQQEEDAESARRALDSARSQERARWRRRCAALMDGDVVATQIRFADVPWPVHTAAAADGVEILLSLDDIALDNVRSFLFALAADEAKGTDTKSTEDARRKVLRDAIRLFHPDKFFARVLPRVRDTDKEKVKEGVERLSRLINELMSAK